MTKCKLYNIVVFLLTFSLGKISFSQNFIINYDITYNNFLQVEKKGVLMIEDNKKSLFIESSKIDSSKFQDDVVFFSKSTRSYEIDYLACSLVSHEEVFMLDSLFEIREEIPTINYDIEKDRKVISGFNCQKFRAKFRGREYVFWISLDFPISIGPWKFVNTPGLIVQAYDLENKTVWSLNSITTKVLNEGLQLIDNRIADRSITLKDFVLIKDDLSENQVKKHASYLKSRLPRNTSMTATYYPGRKGKELIYEWETTDEKK
jgi:GLPGLI family protein